MARLDPTRQLLQESCHQLATGTSLGLETLLLGHRPHVGHRGGLSRRDNDLNAGTCLDDRFLMLQLDELCSFPGFILRGLPRALAISFDAVLLCRKQ